MFEEKEVGKKEKRIGVLFSGGLDSTYLLWKNAKEGHQVIPIYVEIENNDTKTIVEKQAVERIIYYLRNENPSFEIRDPDYNVRIHINNNKGLSFVQPMIWMHSLLFSIDRFDELHIGYVSGDDSVLYIDELKKMFDSTKPFRYQDENNVELKFPLIEEKTYKSEMIREMPDELLRMINTCEEPILTGLGIKSKRFPYMKYRYFKPCCKCVPCKRIIANDFYNSDVIKQKYEEQYIKVMKENVSRMELDIEYRNRYVISDKEESVELYKKAVDG